MCSRLKHCGWIVIILHAVIVSHIFGLEVADGEGEVCPRPTAAEPVWDTRGPAGCIIDEEPGSLPRFLLVPGYTVVNTLTGYEVHGDPLTWRHSQGAWRLSHRDVPMGTCNQKNGDTDTLYPSHTEICQCKCAS